MRISFIPARGLYFIWRMASNSKPAIGFKIKRRSAMLFSERNGSARGFCLGPLYFGTYWRRQ